MSEVDFLSLFTVADEFSDEPVYPYEADIAGNEWMFRYDHKVCHALRVMKRTPKGVWIDAWTVKRFVKAGCLKKFACASQQEALESYIARKEKQIEIIETNARSAADELEWAKTVLERNSGREAHG